MLGPRPNWCPVRTWQLWLVLKACWEECFCPNPRCLSPPAPVHAPQINKFFAQKPVIHSPCHGSNIFIFYFLRHRCGLFRLFVCLFGADACGRTRVCAGFRKLLIVWKTPLLQFAEITRVLRLCWRATGRQGREWQSPQLNLVYPYKRIVHSFASKMGGCDWRQRQIPVTWEHGGGGVGGLFGEGWRGVDQGGKWVRTCLHPTPGTVMRARRKGTGLWGKWVFGQRKGRMFCAPYLPALPWLHVAIPLLGPLSPTDFAAKHILEHAKRLISEGGFSGICRCHFFLRKRFSFTTLPWSALSVCSQLFVTTLHQRTCGGLWELRC